jgi:hypothetical protein
MVRLLAFVSLLRGHSRTVSFIPPAAWFGSKPLSGAKVPVVRAASPRVQEEMVDPIEDWEYPRRITAGG